MDAGKEHSQSRDDGSYEAKIRSPLLDDNIPYNGIINMKDALPFKELWGHPGQLKTATIEAMGDASLPKSVEVVDDNGNQFTLVSDPSLPEGTMRIQSSGIVVEIDGFESSTVHPCAACDGSGLSIVSDYDDCGNCDGSGYTCVTCLGPFPRCGGSHPSKVKLVRPDAPWK